MDHTFITPDFLLYNEKGKRLYHEIASSLPIIDYHSHLSATAIRNNHRFANLTEAWLDGDLRLRFASRILPIDDAVADRWGQLAGQAQLRRAALPVIDGLLAATALHHNLTLVTRNSRDVAPTGAAVFNPWKA